MDTILAWLLAGCNVVGYLVDWCYVNPYASLILGTLLTNLIYKFCPHGGFMNDLVDIAYKTWQTARERRKASILQCAIWVLLIGMCGVCAACATTQAVKSQESPQEIAQAACNDLATGFSVAQTALTWTEVYFLAEGMQIKLAKDILDQAEAARAAACAGVDLVVDSASLADFLNKAADIKALIEKVNAAIAKIKGKPAKAKAAETAAIHPPVEASIDMDPPRRPDLNGTAVVSYAASGWSGAVVGMWAHATQDQ